MQFSKHLYTFRNINYYNFQWTQVPGGLKWVASGDNIVVGVNSNDNIYYRVGITADNPVGEGWVQVSGGLSQIDVYGTTVWGRNSAMNIYTCPLSEV